MAKAVYVQKGEIIDFKNTTAQAIPLGDVVKLSSRIGVAGDEIKPGVVGALYVEGVFALPTSETFAVGAAVYWTGTAATATQAGNTPAGWATGMGAGVVNVKIGG